MSTIERAPITLLWGRDRMSDRLVAAIDRAIRGWAGTRYMTGQQVRGEHADCVRFACGVLDDLYGRRRELPRNLAIDAAIHAPEVAWAHLRRLLEVYPEAEPLRLRGVLEVEPGDIVVCGLKNGGPGHLVIVGAEPGTCWEAPRPRCEVRKIGVGLYPAMHVKHAFRMRDREGWAG